MAPEAVVAAVLFLAGRGLPGGQKEGAAPRIGRIEIVCGEVFEPDPSGHLPWLFKTANKLHIKTREGVVRRELLFQSGDLLDPEALAQTERNLRAFEFVRDARVEALPSPGDGGPVDVRVTTADSWSTVLELGFSKAGDVLNWTVGASERNLLGRGKHIELVRTSDIDRDAGTFFYRDPRVGGTRLGAAALFSERSDGRRAEFRLSRPFYSLSSAWSFQLHLEGFDQMDPLYAAGERVDELRHVGRRGEIELARALSRTSSSAIRLHLAYRRLEDEVEAGLRRFGVVEVGLSSIEHRFLKLTHLNRFESPEDINLGNEAAAFLGFSAAPLGGEEGQAFFFFLDERRGFLLGPERFLLGRASWQARHRRGRIENSLALFRLDYYNKLSPRRLLVASAQLHYGSRLDPERQLTLGAENGLQGYPVRQWTGNRLLLLAAEKRLFLADDVARLASFALAGFFEAGYVWPEGERLALGDLKADVGGGLLIGRNRLATRRGVRLDLAYALHPIPGRSRWLFSASSSIAF